MQWMLISVLGGRVSSWFEVFSIVADHSFIFLGVMHIDLSDAPL